MIKAVFYRKNNSLIGFDISGHSGYADSGSDIVCASVSSSAMLTANLITDYLGFDADVTADGNVLSLKIKDHDKLPQQAAELSHKAMLCLYDHIGFISEDYKGTVRLTLTEV